MKPNRTSTILRKLFKELGADYKLCSMGYPTDEALEKHPMPDPLDFTDPAKFARAYGVYNLARKREVKDPTSLQMKNALDKWVESEWRCHVVNQHGRWVEPLYQKDRDRISRLLQATRTIISGILMDEWPVMDFDPTGGATATVSRLKSLSSSKVDGTPLTRDMQPHKCAPASRVYLEMMLHNNPAVARRFMAARYQLHDVTSVFDLYWPTDEEIRDLALWMCSNVPPASFDKVPKTFSEVRLIGKSNSISIMVQKTFGNAIRKALYDKAGIDLNDQTINQEWAEIGSLTGLVATVDLSAASDSISRHCLTLFPKRWQAYFNASRDTHVAVKQHKHKLAMVAGMGNGYIFELESLLFYAMTRAVVEELKLDTSMISVYGDDIICPVDAVPLLEEYFLALGFLLNKEKSFTKGKFRESCGKHYFNGVDVTPWFVKGDLDELEEIYHCHNGLSEWSYRTGIAIDSSLRQIAGLVKVDQRNIVPPSWSTKSGFHYPVDDCRYPMRKWNKKYQRYDYIFSALVPKNGVDIREMLPKSMQIVHSLIQAEASNKVCDDAFFRKAVIGCRYNPPIGRKRFTIHGGISEYTEKRLSWSSQPVYHCKKHRREIF